MIRQITLSRLAPDTNETIFFRLIAELFRSFHNIVGWNGSVG